MSTSSELATDLICGRVTLGSGAVEDLDARAVHDGPVAFIEIGDGVGEGGERDGIAAEVHFAAAVADGERAALPRGDHQIVLAGEDDAERKGAPQLAERGLDGLDRAQAVLHLVGDEMHDGFRVRIGLELVAALRELGLELAIVLDDAVVHDRDLRRHVRMSVALGRPAVRGPARMTDSRVPRQRLRQQAAFEVSELAFGAAAIEMAVLDGGDAGAIIAAILEASQRIHEIGRDGLRAQNANDATHLLRPLRVTGFKLR